MRYNDLSALAKLLAKAEGNTEIVAVTRAVLDLVTDDLALELQAREPDFEAMEELEFLRGAAVDEIRYIQELGEN